MVGSVLLKGLFGRVLLATGLSDTATGVFGVAAVVLVTTSSGSRSVALGTGAATLPWLLFALPAGPLVDRVSRPRAIGTADPLRGLVMPAASAPSHGGCRRRPCRSGR